MRNLKLIVFSGGATLFSQAAVQNYCRGDQKIARSSDIQFSDCHVMIAMKWPTEDRSRLAAGLRRAHPFSSAFFDSCAAD